MGEGIVRSTQGRRAFARGSGRALPAARCPKIDSVAYPWKIIQTPNSYVFVYETFTYWRQIFTDGRTVDPDANPTWMGYSTGRWDGDAFVVDTAGSTEGLARPARAAGTDRLHVIERFTRPIWGAWSSTSRSTIQAPTRGRGGCSQEIYLRPDWEPLEFICGENNRDVEKLPGGHHVVTNVEAAKALGITVR